MTGPNNPRVPEGTFEQTSELTGEAVGCAMVSWM
ncbi:Uncharacterised protein [Mycobacteroides abscessus subsp. abscessus]|nr:Uncharacterised protein [Mycobacteroides abscessus subsp. abscessus]